MEALEHQRKSLILIILKQLHYNADNSYFYFNGNKIFKFKADNENVNFPTQFVLELYLVILI